MCVCVSEALELISTAANHSNAAIRKMVRNRTPPWLFSFWALISFWPKQRSALPNRIAADPVASASSVVASVCDGANVYRNGTDRKLPFPDSSFVVWLCNSPFLYQFPPSGHFNQVFLQFVQFLWAKLFSILSCFPLMMAMAALLIPTPSVKHPFLSDLFNSRRRCTNCWRFMKGLGERRTSSTQPTNSSKRDTSKRCRPKMEQHKTDTSTWWEVATVETMKKIHLWRVRVSLVMGNCHVCF